MSTHPRRQHHHNGKDLPHLNDAVDTSNGKADQHKLKEGMQHWQAAIDSGEFEIETVHELPIPGDSTRDILTVVRRKTGKADDKHASQK